MCRQQVRLTLYTTVSFLLITDQFKLLPDRIVSEKDVLVLK